MISGKSGLALDQVTASEGGSSQVFILFEAVYNTVVVCLGRGV
jgi:hypothetical protein